jgi:hypothetical protein
VPWISTARSLKWYRNRFSETRERIVAWGVSNLVRAWLSAPGLLGPPQPEVPEVERI